MRPPLIRHKISQWVYCIIMLTDIDLDLPPRDRWHAGLLHLKLQAVYVIIHAFSLLTN